MKNSFIFEKGSEEQKTVLKSCMGKELSPEQIKQLQMIFKESGAIEFGKAGVLEYSQKAKSILEQLEINNLAKESILALIKKMEKLEH